MSNSLITAIAIIAVIGAAVAFKFLLQSKRAQQLPAKQGISDFPPKPKWKPNVPVDIQRTINVFAYYTNRKRIFAVFAHGTCVLLPEDSKDTEKEAKEILDKVYHYHPDFNPQAMDDGNFLISYSQPAYSVVFKDELEANRDYIEENHLDGVVRAEVLLNAKGEPNKFDERGKTGLFGRARMFLDAQNPVVVQVWKPD